MMKSRLRVMRGAILTVLLTVFLTACGSGGGGGDGNDDVADSTQPASNLTGQWMAEETGPLSSNYPVAITQNGDTLTIKQEDDLLYLEGTLNGSQCQLDGTNTTDNGFVVNYDLLLEVINNSRMEAKGERFGTNPQGTPFETSTVSFIFTRLEQDGSSTGYPTGLSPSGGTSQQNFAGNARIELSWEHITGTGFYTVWIYEPYDFFTISADAYCSNGRCYYRHNFGQYEGLVQWRVRVHSGPWSPVAQFYIDQW